MRVLELIEKLKEFEKNYGDLEVTIGGNIFIELLDYDTENNTCKVCNWKGDFVDNLDDRTIFELIRDECYDEIQDELAEEIRDNIYCDVRDELRDELMEDLEEEVKKELRYELEDRVISEITNEERDEIYNSGFNTAIEVLKNKKILPKDFKLETIR